jgi:PAS domain S-box-containing protein
MQDEHGLWEGLPVALCRTAPDGRLLDANAAFVECFRGVSRAALLAIPAEAFYEVPAERLRWGTLFAAEGIVRAFETRMRRADGTGFWARLFVRGARGADGALIHYDAMVEDLTKAREAEEALRATTRLNRHLVEHLPDRILVKDRNSVILFCNTNYARDLGLSPAEIIGTDAFAFYPRAMAEAYHADDQDVMAHGLKDLEEPYTVHGEERWVHTVKVPYLDEAGAVVGVLAVFEDITTAKRLEAHLREAQKLEAIGQLAAGIAHDFNNLLGVITGYTELILRHLSADDSHKAKVERILEAAGKAAGLTKQLLAFGQQQVLEPRVLDLNAIVSGMQDVLRRLIGEGITLFLELMPGLGAVQTDAGQIHRVLLGLASNARDAMPTGGRMTITTSNSDPESENGAPPLPCPGRWVMLSVGDTGSGMDEATRARVFDPFFTTKDVGKGSGLGLSMVHGFVHQSHGHIRIESEVGHGTTVQVYLPQCDDAAPAEASTTA